MDELTLKKILEYLGDINNDVQNLNIQASGQNIKMITDILCKNQIIFNTVQVELSRIEKEKGNERNESGKGSVSQ